MSHISTGYVMGHDDRLEVREKSADQAGTPLAAS
jgi:hypothetical protein